MFVGPSVAVAAISGPPICAASRVIAEIPTWMIGNVENPEMSTGPVSLTRHDPTNS